MPDRLHLYHKNGLLAWSDGADTWVPVAADEDGKLQITVSGVEIDNTDGAILDGADGGIKATVKDYTGSNPLAVVLVDTDGDAYVASGGEGGGGGAVTVADGADVTLGAIADAAVLGNNSGTVSAKLRGIDQILNDVWDSVAHTFSVDDNGSSLTVDNAGLTSLAGAIAGTEVQVDIVSSALPSGAATAAKQPALGTAGTASADVLTVQGVASMTPLLVNGSGVTQPVSATNLDIRDLDAASDDIAVHGDVGILDQLDLTNANPATVAIVDANGDQITSFGGGTEYTEGATDATITGSAMLMEGAANTLLPVQGTVADGLLVNLGSNNDVTVTGTVAVTQSGTWDEVGIHDSGNSITVDNGGTFAVQVDGAALTALQLIDDAIATTGSAVTAKANLVAGTDGTNARALKVDSSGELQIDVLTLPALVAGTANIGDVDVLTLPGIVGSVADDATTPGAPVMVGGMAKSPDGTDPGNVSAEDDVARVTLDLNRRLFVNDRHPNARHAHLDGSSAYTDQSIASAPGSGYQVIITSITGSTGAATALNFFLEEGSTKIFGPIYLEAVAGRGYCSGPISLPVSANTAVTLTSSASIAQSFDIDYYIQKV